MGLNATAAVVALVLIRGLGWTFGVTGVDKVRLIQLLAAGFGAMALFRTSLFTIRVGEQDIAVGPSSFLQVALLAADREVDRKRATLRSERTRKAMEGVSFKKALEALPVYCIALMQNLPQEDQNQLSSDIAKLAKSTNINDRIKSFILGLALINHVGDDVLEAAVSSLGNEIKEEPAPGDMRAP